MSLLSRVEVGWRGQWGCCPWNVRRKQLESLQLRTWRDQDPLNFLCAEPLCFACGDNLMCPCRPKGTEGRCAAESCCGQCAAVGGNGGFGGYKAHGCDLLVKRGAYGHPFPCLHDVGLGCQDSKLLDCFFHQSVVLQFPDAERTGIYSQSSGSGLVCHPQDSGRLGCRGDVVMVMENGRVMLKVLSQDEMTVQGLSPFSS